MAVRIKGMSSNIRLCWFLNMLLRISESMKDGLQQVRKEHEKKGKNIKSLCCFKYNYSMMLNADAKRRKERVLSVRERERVPAYDEIWYLMIQPSSTMVKSDALVTTRERILTGKRYC